MFDYIVIGAGIAGITMAERLANRHNRKVLLVEKRDHIGGNCFDYVNNDGLIIHKYGPHLFHTKHEDVWDYLSQFTEWYEYRHRVLGFIDGEMVPIPFNLDSLKKIFPREKSSIIEKKLIDNYGLESRVPVIELRKSEDDDLKKFGDFVYQKVFYNYTCKQWGMPPEKLDPLVISRVPVTISRNDEYFSDKYQAVPLKGYTAMFNNMLKNPSIDVFLNTDYNDILKFDLDHNKIFLNGKLFSGKVVFTGRIDELMNFCFGELPYRSLSFEFEDHECDYYQPAGTVNYPNDHAYTRITEFKHFCKEKKEGKTVIIKEYPQECNRLENGKDIPYYPIPRQENAEQFNRYFDASKKIDNIIFLGRLAEYRYYNMDEVVKKALDLSMKVTD